MPSMGSYFGSHSGCTPPHLAAARGHVDTIEALLQAKPAVDSGEEGNWTPLHLAGQNGKVEAVEAPLSAGPALGPSTLLYIMVTTLYQLADIHDRDVYVMLSSPVIQDFLLTQRPR
jgi:ankyrin repeat protein